MNKTEIEMIRDTACFDVEWGCEFILRQPEQSDILVLTEIDHEGLTQEDLAGLAYPDSVQRFFDYIPENSNVELSRHASCVVLVAGKIIAFCLFIAEKSEVAHLYNIHVAESYRRRGNATKMIQRGLTTLADKYQSVNLDTVREDASFLLFKKLGFKVIKSI